MRILTLVIVLLGNFLGSGLAQVQAAPFGEDLARARSGTLVVRSDDLDNQFLGSAFVFLDGRTVITNAHVVGMRSSILLTDRNGHHKQAQVVYVDQLRDIAVLTVETPYQEILSPASLDPVEAQLVFAIGAPLGEGFSISSGIVSALDRQKEPTVPVGFIQHDAAVNPGSSGGPLVGLDGAVLGMNTQIADGSRYFVGLAYAIPFGELVAAVDRANSGVHHPAPDMGIRVRPLTAKVAAALNLKDQTGVLVDHVVPGAMAEQSGIQGGDILVSVGGVDLNKTGDLAYALEALQGRDTPATATLLRNGATITVTLTVPAKDSPVLGQVTSGAQKKQGYKLPELGLSFDESGVLGDVSDSTMARSVGLAKGDVVIAINGVSLSDQKAGWNTDYAHTGPILLLIRLSDGSTRHFMVDPWSDIQRLSPLGGANILDQDVVVF